MTKKLLIDTIAFDLHIVESDADTPEGYMKLEGVFQQSDKLNTNKRSYPRKIWSRLLAESSPVMERVRRGHMAGHSEHPKDGATKLPDISHKVTHLELREDGTVFGSLWILDTAPGLHLQKLVRAGMPLGISSRGTGTVGANGVVQEDYRLETFDLVYNPSTPDAYPKLVEDEVRNDGADNTKEPPTMNGAERIRFLGKTVRLSLQTPIRHLDESQLKLLTESIDDAEEQISDIVTADPTCAGPAQLLLTQILAKRSELANLQEAEDDAVDEEDDDIDLDALIAESQAQTELLEAAKKELESVNADLAASIKLNESLQTKAAEYKAAADAWERKYNASVALFGAYREAQEQAVFAEAIDDLIAENPVLESVREMLSSAGSISEAVGWASKVLNEAGGKPTGQNTKPVVTESQKAKAEATTITESANTTEAGDGDYDNPLVQRMMRLSEGALTFMSGESVETAVLND